jgi:HEAT repeat protein
VYYKLAGIYKSLTMAAGRFVQPDDKDGLKDVGPVEGGNWTLAQKVNHLATLIEKVEQHQKTWSETRDKVRTPDQIKATLRAETVAQLEKRLTDPYFRPLAIEALGERGPTAKSAVPALVRLLTENSSASASAKALARIKSDWHREAISLYEAGLADPDMQRRAGAVRALGYIGPPAASVLPALEKQRTYLNANKTRLLESELDVLDELNNTIPLIKGLIRRVD